jgi:hypothetical protein
MERLLWQARLADSLMFGCLAALIPRGIEGESISPGSSGSSQ